MSNPITKLTSLGQSIWYDYIRRAFLTPRELGALVEQGLRGVTSNPTIFQQAIAKSSAYAADLTQLAKEIRYVLSGGEEVAKAFRIVGLDLVDELAESVRAEARSDQA